MGCIPNRTSTKGYLRKLKSIALNRDYLNYTNFYNTIYLKKDRVMFRCAVTGYETENKPMQLHKFPDIKSICVYMAHKSGMYKVSTIYFGKREALSNWKCHFHEN